VIYQLRHRTTYRYEGDVRSAVCVLRLAPQSSRSQTVLSSQIVVTPAPSHSAVRTGPFGEQEMTVTIESAHQTLVIEARSQVDVHAPVIDAAAPSLAWEQVRAEAFRSTGLDPEAPASYLYPTARTPLVAEITDYARESFAPGRPVVQAADDLMRRIRKDFTYDAKATSVSTPIREAFAKRRGVCQDFAHIMIAGLRGLGLPAAYVSGYIRTLPPPGKPRLEGADATHAWVSLWCGPQQGWIGLDPTNALLTQNDHITLAMGRDYSDVAPIGGVILAPGVQTLKVEVDVVPEGEAVVALAGRRG
jgi:transglutaminase-like putative cysteine protease